MAVSLLRSKQFQMASHIHYMFELQIKNIRVAHVYMRKTPIKYGVMFSSLRGLLGLPQYY